MPAADPIPHARRINRTWIVRGDLPDNTERYLDALATRDPALLREVCERAIAATRLASQEQRDPKPDFYATLFSRATPAEREQYLRNHPWTHQRSTALSVEQ